MIASERSTAKGVDALNLAFLGCGAATRRHSHTLSHPGFRVRRLYASQDPRRAQAFCRNLGGAGWFHSYEAAIRDATVDAVLVATPPVSHLALTLEALAAGKHVIVEKPAFLESRDFDAVTGAVEGTRTRVFVAENYFYKPLAARLRALVGSGRLGEIRFIQINALKKQSGKGWRADASVAGGGALFEGGIHWVSFLGNLGLEVAEVRGFRSDPGPEMDRSFLVTFRFAEGAVGTLHYSWEIPAPLGGLRLSGIYGTRGSVLFESNGLFILSRRTGPAGRIPRLEVPSLQDLLGYRSMFSDFLAAIRTGVDPDYTLARARTDLERVESAYGTSGPVLEPTTESNGRFDR